VLNPRFEEPDTADVTWAPVGAGWDFFVGGTGFHSGVSQENMTFTNGTLTDAGEQMGVLWCGSDEIAQTIHGFEIGTTYDISWTEGARSGYSDVYLWVLMDGATLMASHNLSFTGSLTQQTVQFTATSTSHRLRFFNSGGWDQMVHIDDVQIVPEPATMMLLGLGSLALIRKRK